MKIVTIWQSPENTFSDLGFDIIVDVSRPRYKYTYLDNRSSKIWDSTVLFTHPPEDAPFVWRLHE